MAHACHPLSTAECTSTFTAHSSHQPDHLPYWRESEIMQETFQSIRSFVKIDVMPESRQQGALHSWLVRINLPRMHIHDKLNTSLFELAQKHPRSRIGE